MNKIEHKKRSYKQNLSVGLLLPPPKSDEIYAQLTRGALIKNHFLQNPHFSHLTLISVKNRVLG